MGAVGSSSSITSFSASVKCSVDLAGRTLLVGSVSPLGGGGGGGIPWSDGLVVTKDAGTLITSSGCVFVADGWVRLCVTVEMRDHKRDKIELFLHPALGSVGHPPTRVAIGLKPLILDLTCIFTTQ